LEIPHQAGVRVPLLETCPLCSGTVVWAGFQEGRYREQWERARAG
jgi:tRNA(Arg) A34 adenosine deaminase TadA